MLSSPDGLLKINQEKKLKKLASVLFLFVCFSTSATPSKCNNGNFKNNKLPLEIKFDQEICYLGFNVLYSYKSKSPIAVGEYLTADKLLKGYQIARSNEFFVDTSIPAPYRAMMMDYKRSGYDKGHQAPAADAFDQQSKDQTFVMSNMVPQTPALNRQTWRMIEEDVRENVIKHDLSAYIVTGSIYPSSPKTIGNGIWVPDYSYKAVQYSNNTEVIFVAANTPQEPDRLTLTEAQFEERFKFNPFKQE